MFTECSNGFMLSIKYVDIQKIGSMLKQVNNDLLDLKLLDKLYFQTPSIIYNVHYDILHKLAQILLLFDKTKSANHQCLFAYICYKHPELMLDWNMMENIRMKRNDTQYYLTTLTEDEWNQMKHVFIKYIENIKEAVEKKLLEYNQSI
jgi:hypothetical protein